MEAETMLITLLTSLLGSENIDNVKSTVCYNNAISAV